jgi:hypothetical protein
MKRLKYMWKMSYDSNGTKVSIHQSSCAYCMDFDGSGTLRCKHVIMGKPPPCQGAIAVNSDVVLVCGLIGISSEHPSQIRLHVGQQPMLSSTNRFGKV